MSSIVFFDLLYVLCLLTYIVLNSYKIYILSIAFILANISNTNNLFVICLSFVCFLTNISKYNIFIDKQFKQFNKFNVYK